MINNSKLDTSKTLDTMLESLNLLAIRDVYQKISEQVIKGQLSPIDYLQELVQIELEQRYQRTIMQLIKSAKLPRNKLLIDFDISRIPNLHPGLLKNLSGGDFIERSENLLIFGNPGTGKSHLSMALAREWCLRGRKCLYLTAASLVQELLIAKNKFSLNQFIKRLDRFEALIIDDISYIPYEKSESEVLFVLLAERYEQRSVVITSNLVFSKWQQIFKDEMTTNAAIDRLVHHSTILELNAESYRIKTAKGNQQNSQEQVAKKLEKQNNKKENKNVI
ncbi:IS21-like element helper ATPase IstB [Candidatus Tisiphia endosymbiont of Nedyus quadrimaculatus]|uniref:IS21-like element helper ATPase IstB n=1 Tax=Candidatus Tisiphia endosymbiont of Nedyus quadrimaculatus TaxID=3139332 RepID=UPI00345E9328